MPATMATLKTSFKPFTTSLALSMIPSPSSMWDMTLIKLGIFNFKPALVVRQIPRRTWCVSPSLTFIWLRRHPSSYSFSRMQSNCASQGNDPAYATVRHRLLSCYCGISVLTWSCAGVKDTTDSVDNRHIAFQSLWIYQVSSHSCTHNFNVSCCAHVVFGFGFVQPEQFDSCLAWHFSSHCTTTHYRGCRDGLQPGER